MKLSELCIKRPVFTSMLIFLPLTLGIFSLVRMGVDLFPNVDLPIVFITTTRMGTSVEEMETGVTKVIEEAVNTISGIDELRSTTKEGISSVVVTFFLEKNRDIAQQEVQSKINTILARLPTGTDTPIIDKFDIDASPVLTIAVSGNRDLRELTEIADKQVKEALSSLNGVGSVAIVGGRKRAIKVTVDARQLEAYNLSIDQVRRALAAQNLELPGGRVDQASRELVLRTMGRVDRRRPVQRHHRRQHRRPAHPHPRHRHRRRQHRGAALHRPAGRRERGPAGRAEAERHQHGRGHRHRQEEARADRRCLRIRRARATCAWRSSATSRASSTPRSTRCKKHLILGGILVVADDPAVPPRLAHHGDRLACPSPPR